MSRNEWKARGRQRVKDAASGELWKPSEGTNYLRILPNKDGLDHPPWLEWGIHREVGPEKSMFRCGLDVGDSCWLCDKLKQLAKDPRKATLVQRASRDNQIVLQISTIGTETEEYNYSEPKAWWLRTGGQQTLGIRVISLLTRTQRDYDHPTKGFNISLTRTGTGLKTRYSEPEPDLEPSAIPKALKPKIKPLEELIPAYDAEGQKAAYFGRERADATEEASEWAEGEAEEDEAAEGPSEWEDDGEEEPTEEEWSDEAEEGESEEEEESETEDEEAGEDWSWDTDEEEEQEAEDEEPPPPPVKRKRPAAKKTVTKKPPAKKTTAKKTATKKAPAKKATKRSRR